MGPFHYKLRVEYPTPELATMVVNTMKVDKELQAEKVSRELTSEGNLFIADFAAVDAKLLRASVCTFLDLMAVATRAYEVFGPPLPVKS